MMIHVIFVLIGVILLLNSQSEALVMRKGLLARKHYLTKKISLHSTAVKTGASTEHKTFQPPHGVKVQLEHDPVSFYYQPLYSNSSAVILYFAK